MMRRLLISLTAAALAGCSLQPAYLRPAAPVPAAWPIGDPYLSPSGPASPNLTYRDVFTDPRLQQLVVQALADNRDLRIAAANILAARAQYRIQRADLLPQIEASTKYTRTGGDGASSNASSSASRSGDSYTASIGATAFELDLFGRVRSLTGAALNRYLETEAGARATRLTLIGDVAEAWLTYAADQSLLQIAQDTAVAAQRSVDLTSARLKGGVAPRTDLRQAQTVLATAQSDIATQRTAVAQDINALQLLVGAPVDPRLLPGSIDEAAGGLTAAPAGLQSSILLRRPDVIEAEYELKAANAEIGAARAALFPAISLTSVAGYASTALSSLFTGGAFSYSASPGASLTIFHGGALRAGVAYSKARRDAALATYERAIQAAFRETADALARQGTIADQTAAGRTLVAAAEDTYQLSYARYKGGTDTFLASLSAQQSLYSARRSFVATQLAGATNRVALYRAVSGDDSIDAAR